MINPVGIRVVKGDNTIPVSNQVPDPFKELYSYQALIEPPYNPDALVQMPEYSNILQPLIDAYKTNITGFGYSFKYLIDMESEEIQPEIIERAKMEWQALEFFYEHCNYDKGFTELTKMMIKDRETIGWGAIEVIPRGNGMPGGLEHLPSHTLRLSELDPRPQKIPVITIGIYGKKLTITYIKKFRRFCQLTNHGTVWFKEFGDPRKLDKITGLFQEDSEKPITSDRLANSVMYFPLSVSYSPYGIPRWLGNMLSTIGSRKSEELNYYYFIQGKHVPMAILVNNGSLTESSISKLEEYANEIRGVEKAHGFLILEADSGEEEVTFDDKSKPPVRIDLKPLTQVIQHDALFQEYDKNNRDKVRASMRLPPIYTGESRDYTRATADTARSIAEEQIFNPERFELADKFNKLINHQLDIRYAALYFKGPDLSNKLTLSQALNPYIKAGALTPNMLIELVSDLLGQEFEQIPEDWGNKPLALAIAEIGKGTQVDPVKPAKKGPTVLDSTAGSKIKS